MSISRRPWTVVDHMAQSEDRQAGPGMALREGERRARAHDAPERRHGRQEQPERDGDAERAENR